jgi:hypothetical protein
MRLTIDLDSMVHVSYVDGKEFGSRRISPLSNGKTYRASIQVREEGTQSAFKIAWDGTPDFIQWNGATDALRNYDRSDWQTNMIQRPWIGSSNNRMVVQIARLRSLRGLVRRDPLTDSDRQQDFKNGFVRLVGERASDTSVGAWSFCTNQIPLELSGIGAECRWPMITPKFAVCDDYIGAHAPSSVKCQIPTTAKSFSTVAYNDSSRIAKYRVSIEGRDVFTSLDTGLVIIKVDIPPKSKVLELIADPLGDSAYDHTFWCYPRFHTEPVNQVTDKMIDGERTGPPVNITARSAEGAVTRSRPTGELKSGPVSFRDFQPCEEFIFAHAPSTVTFQIPEGMTQFSAIGYNVISHSARFEVWADSKRIFESNIAGIVPINVPLPPNSKLITLKTTDCGHGAGDQAIWCFPRLRRN